MLTCRVQSLRCFPRRTEAKPERRERKQQPLAAAHGYDELHPRPPAQIHTKYVQCIDVGGVIIGVTFRAQTFGPLQRRNAAVQCNRSAMARASWVGLPFTCMFGYLTAATEVQITSPCAGLRFGKDASVLVST